MEKKPYILAVDTNRRNLELLAQVVNKEGFQTIPVNSLEALDQAITEPEGLRLALVDISGFDSSIWERLERLRSLGIPFVVISSRYSLSLQQTSTEHGARSVMVKPLAVKELLFIIRSLSEE